MSIANMQKNIEHVVHIMLENRSFDNILGYLTWASGSKVPPHNDPPLRENEKGFYGLHDTDFWQPSNLSYFLPYGPFQYKRLPVIKVEPGADWDYCEMPHADPGELFQDVWQQVYGWSYPKKCQKVRRMKGFYLNYLVARNPDEFSDQDILTCFTPGTLPVLNALASSYAVSDMWFSSIPTQTNPNRAFSICGTSLGRINNNDDPDTYKTCGQPYATDPRTGKPVNTIFSVFNAFSDANPGRPVTWKIFSEYDWYSIGGGGWHDWIKDGDAGKCCTEVKPGQKFTQYMFPNGTGNTKWGGTGSISDFVDAVNHDTLPSFSYIEPVFYPEVYYEAWHLNSYHPPESVYRGEVFIKSIYDALTANPKVWDRTLLIITFDEHGGTLDHVLPPENAVAPDGNVHTDPDFDFTRYGVRVPTIMVSPWVTPGTVFRGDYWPETANQQALPFDHTTILATLCRWKGIECGDEKRYPQYYLGARTAKAPLFSDVITDAATSKPVDLSVHKNCRVTEKGLHRRSEAVADLSRKLQAITGANPEDTDHLDMVNEILRKSRTREDVQMALDALRKKSN